MKMPAQEHPLAPQPIWEERVLLMGTKLVVADLHIGYETDLLERGVVVPSQTVKMVARLEKTLIKTGADTLIINGDLKHNIPRGGWQEHSEIPNALDTWLKVVDEIHVIKGNHDGSIDKYLPNEVRLHGPRGAVFDDVGIFHGHANPGEEVLHAPIKVMAHTHPSVTLKDGLGRKEKYPCWAKIKYSFEGKKYPLIVMSAYNELLGGTNINEYDYLGPFLKDLDILEEKIFLLDGTYLGEKKL